MAAVEGVDGEMEVSSGYPVAPVSFTDWAYNHPRDFCVSNV